MPSRSVRSATALALAASATTFAYVGSAAPAQAAGYDGYCKTSSGVTVVVDFRGLGGGVAIRCSPVGSGASGLDALQAAGIPVQGTRDAGLSVACRIYGKPTATQDLPGGYHESCARMPPTKAYWSYWQASNGGSWGYAQEGLSSSHVIPGGFEGWSFSEGSAVAPGAAPSRPQAPKPSPPHTTQPPRHTTTTAPKHPTTTTAKRDPAPSKHDGGAGGASQPKSTAAASKAAKKKAAEKKASSSAAHSSTSKVSHSKRSSSSSTSGVTGTSSGGPTNVAVANSDDLIKKSDKSSGINATTVVGGGVLGALAIGGAVVTIIRKRNLG